MAKVRVRPETGNLYLDFSFRGVRCREQAALADCSKNRRTVEALATRIKREIAKGTFSYRTFFPDSPRVAQFEQVALESVLSSTAAKPTAPLFSDFAQTWYRESEPRWRPRHKKAIRATLDALILPTFGSLQLEAIPRAALLDFRACLAQRKGHGGQTLSAKRNNKIMSLLRTILNEGCDRYGLTSPGRSIKPLKQKRSEVQPFTLKEMDLLIATVRADYRPYLTLRLLTGLRTGESDGLQWGDVNFDEGTLRIERTVSRDGDGDTKTDGSRRTIQLVPTVLAALQEQKKQALPGCPWIFHTTRGKPIDVVNFTNRVWYPLLRLLDLKKRPPYQMRHTAATLMLASGENPEWVAATLGHTNTEMLFRVYSRFVPNLTRNDGRAFAGLLNSHQAERELPAQPLAATVDLDAMSPEQLRAALAQLIKTNPGPRPDKEFPVTKRRE